MKLGNDLDKLRTVAGVMSYEGITERLLPTGHAAIDARKDEGVITLAAADAAKDSFLALVVDNYFAQQVKYHPIQAQAALKSLDLFPGMLQEQRVEWQAKADKAALEKKVDIKTNKIMTLPDHKGQIQAVKAITDLELQTPVLRMVQLRQADDIRFDQAALKQQAEEVTTGIMDGAEKGLPQTEMVKLANQTKDAGERKNNLALARVLYEDLEITDYDKFAEAMKLIDTSIAKGEKITIEELGREYRPHMEKDWWKKVSAYHEAGGNVGSLTASDVNNWFTQYTNIPSKDRPKAYAEYWDYLKSRLKPGIYPTSSDINTWTQEFMQTQGVEGGWWDTEMTRGEAIKSGSGSFGKFTPTENRPDPLEIE